MLIQIFGTRKCQDTNKAIRFFKERRIEVHFVDLTEKPITKGELTNITRKISIDDLIDREGKEFRKRNLEHMVFDIEQELLDDPLLFKTPIVRCGTNTTLGYRPEEWKKWYINDLKK